MADDERVTGPFDITGTHAFLFIDHVAETTTPEEVVGKLWEKPESQVLYASTFVGDFQAFAHLRVEEVGEDGIAALQDLIEEIVGIGARCQYGVETRIRPLGAKRKSPRLIVLTRIKLAAPRPDAPPEREDIVAVRDRLIDRTELPEGFVGISLMSGEWDVLLQTTGDSVDQAYDFTKAIVAALPDVHRTSTAFASGRRTEMRSPRGAIEG
jgi:DNA-binding Lrp family transcriptional regulator